ncbi:MAG: RsmE family RNA methyltransferase, partial [Endomicrobiia bacterium]
ENKNLLKDVISEYLSKEPKIPFICNLFIGPEGGFTDKEINFAITYGFRTFSLGRNILRTETAAILSCGIISSLLTPNYEL